MRKQLGMLASLIFLSATALIWTGCSGRCDTNDCCVTDQAYQDYHDYHQPSFGPMDSEIGMGHVDMDEHHMDVGNECCPTAAPVCPPPCRPACPPPPCRPVCPPPAPCQPVCAPEPCRPACQPVCQPAPCQPAPCKPVCAPPCPPCPPKCACPLKPCKYGTCGECACSGIIARARNPKMCMLGDQYPLDFDVIACCDVCEATVTTTLPEGVTYMRSQPEARVEGRRLTWEFGSMSKGQVIPARVWLKCEREGDLCTCFCVKATPVAFCALLCAKPVLVCEKCGPEEVCPGDPINYTITVTNIGTCTAEDVVVTDMLPEGVEGPNCQRNLTFKLGNLEPCQSKKVNFCVTACKRGKICNTAIVSACNANQTSCEFCTCVCCCAIECQKVGPKEVLVGQNAEYQITVVNTGDKVLHEVVVTDTAPSATAIVAAPGANICGKQAVWKLRELKPAERVTFNITLTTCTPGYFTNQANVTTCEGCNTCCEFGTTWRGRPALEVCATSSDNPICVNETSRFEVVVVNKGQEYDSNVGVVVNLPPELVPVNASGASSGQINGSTITYAPLPSLAPRQTAKFYFTVKANAAGDFRPEIRVGSDSLKTPLIEQVSLIVN